MWQALVNKAMAELYRCLISINCCDPKMLVSLQTIRCHLVILLCRMFF
nr:unnamed protein product [Callosobruchus analis]